MAEQVEVWVQLVEGGKRMLTATQVQMESKHNVDHIRKMALGEFKDAIPPGIVAASLIVSESDDPAAARLKLGLEVQDQEFPKTSDEKPLYIHLPKLANNIIQVKRPGTQIPHACLVLPACVFSYYHVSKGALTSLDPTVFVAIWCMASLPAYSQRRYVHRFAPQGV